MRVTKGAVADAEAIARSRRKREAHTLAEAQQRQADLERRPITVTANAGEDGTLYGSIGTSLIARAATEQLGVPVDRRRIVLERPLKELGEHTVPVRVHSEVTATVRVVVAREA